jgi:hypothetical protein
LDAADRNNASPVEFCEVHNKSLLHRAKLLLTRAAAGFGQPLDKFSDGHRTAGASG